MKRLFTKRLSASILMTVCLLFTSLSTFAFEGTDYVNGNSYYLYNIYQSKFLADGQKLDNNAPLLITVSSGRIAIGTRNYTLTKNDAGYYQLKYSTQYYGYSKGDACSASTTNNDRTYWQLISEDEYAAFKTKKTFTVASLNVDGMPKSISLAGNEIKLNPDAKEEAGAIAIGQKLKTMGWDVVSLSEDFNYHSNIIDQVNGIYGAMKHRGILSVGNANLLNYLSQKPLFDTDGLGLLYKLDRATPSAESMTQWGSHYGYTEDGADGLIKKGFRYYLVTLADGTEIDLYIHHMDAETSAGDIAARESQLNQLVATIKASDNKRPIIIMGDTNCRYTRDRLKELLIDAINADERFTIRDPWIQYGRELVYPSFGSGAIMADANGYRQGEVVDKVFYINNKESNIRLVAESYCQDLSFIGEDGEPLADHWPCVVTFSYHDYDPAIDDKESDEKTIESVYLRNRATGKFLKVGGWWNSHAVAGDYGVPMSVVFSNGKYEITSAFGYIGKDAYMDAPGNEERAIKEWEIEEVDHKYYVLGFMDGSKKALTANDPFIFNSSPNTHYVTTAAYNKNDKYQQWEFLTEAQLDKENVLGTDDTPYNVTYKLPGANFDRNDVGNSKWAFTKASNQVSEATIGGLDNHERGNCNWQVTTTKKPNLWTASNNKWTLSQTIEGLKNGTYKVTFQGFYKEESQSGEHKIQVTAGDKDILLRNIYEEGDGCTRSLVADNEENKNGKYYPTTQWGASYYFNANLYKHEIADIKVTDGKLTINVAKTDNTGSYTTWTCLDNFQIYYIHEHQPSALWESDDEVHRQLCVDSDCDHLYTEAAHTYASEDVTEGEAYYSCEVCQHNDKARKAAYEEYLYIKIGINDTETTTAPSTIFTVTGVRVSKVTAPGIYIINGKKNIIK